MMIEYTEFSSYRYDPKLMSSYHQTIILSPKMEFCVTFVWNSMRLGFDYSITFYLNQTVVFKNFHHAKTIAHGLVCAARVIKAFQPVK